LIFFTYTRDHYLVRVLHGILFFHSDTISMDLFFVILTSLVGSRSYALVFFTGFFHFVPFAVSFVGNTGLFSGSCVFFFLDLPANFP